ncbi:MAG: DNA primase [Mesorhizobium sp.]|nr:MAG: DNA primase [Mesorhizobium sp.]
MSFISELADELDLEFFFERESLAYKMGRGASGMQINAKHCPNCDDSRYRVYLNADTGFGNCFVCNETFNKAKFIHRHFDHADTEWGRTAEVLKEVLRDQGWRPKRTVGAAVEMPSTVKLPYSHELPLDTGENLTYLEQRGVTPELTRYFHLRWCEFGWWDYKKEDGTPARQHFDNRIIIPVFDLDGTMVTYQGRDLLGPPEDETAFYRKYLFPIGLPGTGRFLLNGQNVHLTEEVAMGEGAFDIIAMKAAFDGESALRNVVPVGSFGKHLSYGSPDGNDQLGRFIKLKAMGVKRVTIMWDGEEKALKAALDAAKLLNGIGLVARIALLPADKDPNEVLPEVVRKAYWEAVTWTPVLDIKWRLKNPYRVPRTGIAKPVIAD